jgi:hypothetical protein
MSSQHGLRKILGKMLAESGATTREIMSIFGHDSIAHAELYRSEVEQKSLPARVCNSRRRDVANRLANRQKIFDLKKLWRSRQKYYFRAKATICAEGAGVRTLLRAK